MTDNEIIKALKRLKNTKDYLKEQYQELVKKCHYPELKPIAKQTYEENKKAFDIAIKAIEEFNRQKAEIEKLEKVEHFSDKTIATQQAEIERLQKGGKKAIEIVQEARAVLEKDIKTAKAEAIKEFAERLKAYHHFYSVQHFEDTIDNLVKEMVGDDK